MQTAAVSQQELSSPTCVTRRLQQVITFWVGYAAPRGSGHLDYSPMQWTLIRKEASEAVAPEHGYRKREWGKAGFNNQPWSSMWDLRFPRRWLWRTSSSGMLHRVAPVRTDVSEEPSASIIRVTRIG
jgi:hypothetical protein